MHAIREGFRAQGTPEDHAEGLRGVGQVQGAGKGGPDRGPAGAEAPGPHGAGPCGDGRPAGRLWAQERDDSEGPEGDTGGSGVARVFSGRSSGLVLGSVTRPGEQFAASTLMGV